MAHDRIITEFGIQQATNYGAFNWLGLWRTIGSLNRFGHDRIIMTGFGAR